jgi:hypothetical protein
MSQRRTDEAKHETDVVSSDLVLFDDAALREVMATIRYDLVALHKDSPYDRQRIAANVDRTLKDCEAIMARWTYYYRKGNDERSR